MFEKINEKNVSLLFFNIYIEALLASWHDKLHFAKEY
jgi:hypothetical protein